MKILIISTHPLDDNRIKKHIRTLLSNGYEITYVNCSESKKADFVLTEKIELIHFNISYEKKNLIKVFFNYIKIRKLINKIDAEIIHVHDPIFISLFKKAKKRGMMTVFDKHERYETIRDFNARVATRLEYKNRKFIDGVAFVTKEQIEYLKSIGIENLKHIPNFQSKYDYPQKLLKEDINRVKLIYMGDLSSQTRDIVLMLHVIKDLLKQKSNIEVILGGQGLDKESHDIVNGLAELYSNFIYYGYMKYDDVIKHTLDSDIGFYFTKDHPNNYNSSPNKIYEYLISGCILVGVGKFADHDLIHQQCGLIFDYNTRVDIIVTEIIKLIDDKNKMKDFKEKAKSLGESFTWESVESRYIDLYNKK